MTTGTWTPARIAADVEVLIVEQLGVDQEEVTPTATINDLGADSLDTIEILMALEDHFDVEITDDDAEKWTTVKDINDYLTGRLAGK